ncbi:MAG: DUF1284 domain-containing protein [Roseburia sp.]
MSEFRAHHILCTLLYEGEGYSGAFCENMTAIVEHLRGNLDENLHLVAKSDRICAGCPNCVEPEHCALENNSVVDKDRGVMRQLGLEENAVYTYRELCKKALDGMTEDFFEESCGTCDWRRRGLCRYEDLKTRLSHIAEQKK